MPPTFLRTVPLRADLGVVAGQRLVLLSLEVWTTWGDLRFGRIDEGAVRPLARRVPPLAAWTITDDTGAAVEVLDVVGRGDRAFTNGEARLAISGRLPGWLDVSVMLVPDGEAHATRVEIG